MLHGSPESRRLAADPGTTWGEHRDPRSSPPRSIDPERPTVDAAAPSVFAGSGSGWLAPGDHVGPFQINRVLGEGGFGVVYHAEQLRPIRRPVALKVLKPGMDSREIIARFEGERQALAQLDHPSIATILDAGVTDQGRPYFAMEYVPGVTITTYADENRFTVAQRVELMLEVCDAVQHAHLRGIIHRDLKPANILVSRDTGAATATTNPVVGARVRIIDFGIAKARTPAANSARTMDGTFLGTPEYMSPEQAGSLGLDVDTRSDIYSLGVVLYELLTGRLPIEAPTRETNPLELIAMVRDKEPAKPSDRIASQTRQTSFADLGYDPRGIAVRRATDVASLRTELARDLDWIVLKCLEKDRERRYTTARDLASDLRRYLTGEAVLASPPTLMYRATKFVKRYKLLVGAASAVGLALIAGTAAATWGYVQARTQRDAAVEARSDAERETATAQAVRIFLQDVLAAGDPEKGATPTTTIREALDAAARRVESGAFKEQPLVEAEVRMVLGDTYMSLGLFDAAEPHTTKAVAIRKQALGEQDLKYAEALNSLGYLLDELAKYPEAEATYRACVEAFRAHRATQPVNLAVSMNNLASLLRRTGRLADAEKTWREAIDIVQDFPGRDETSFAQMLDNLGLCMRQQNKLDAAETLARDALATLRKTRAESPSVARSMGNLGSVLQERGKLSEAEGLFAQTLEMQKKFFEPPHPEIVTALNNLAIVKNLRGDATTGEPLMREALSMCETSLGPLHPETIFTRLNHAVMLGNAGRLEEAEALTARVIAECREHVPESRLLARALATLGDWKLEQMRFAEAIEPLRESAALREKLLGPADLDTSGTLAMLADALVFGERSDEGLKVARDAADRRAEKVSDGDAGLLQVRSTLAAAVAMTTRDEAERAKSVDEMKKAAETLAGDAAVPLDRARRALSRVGWWEKSRGGDGGVWMKRAKGLKR
ncbi:MAG TPA: serine/threonine-protein kinase [Phycisphaerales bacterium]